MANPIVTIEMENGGIIRAELYPDVAPNTVNNFIIDGFCICNAKTVFDAVIVFSECIVIN